MARNDVSFFAPIVYNENNTKRIRRLFMTILYFSATGNCLSVAKKIGGELLSIPKLVKEGRYEIIDDVIGVICPTYCADAPKMVQDYLSKAKLNADYTFMISTYGYLAGAATSHDEDYLNKAAGHADYVAKIIMVDTALTRFETQKQLDTLPEKDVPGQIEKVVAEIKARKKGTPKVSLFDKAVDLLYHKAGASQIADDSDKRFIITDACIKCGTCAKICPADNIRVTDRVEYLHHCEGCLGCMHNCPKQAIHLKNEQSSVRFRNKEVSLKELINANN